MNNFATKYTTVRKATSAWSSSYQFRLLVRVFTSPAITGGRGALHIVLARGGGPPPGCLVKELLQETSSYQQKGEHPKVRFLVLHVSNGHLDLNARLDRDRGNLRHHIRELMR